MEPFGQLNSAVLILFPPSTLLQKLSQPLLRSTLLHNNGKRLGVVNIVFLLKAKRSIIADATKQNKTKSSTRSQLDLHTDRSVFTAMCRMQHSLLLGFVKANCNQRSRDS